MTEPRSTSTDDIDSVREYRGGRLGSDSRPKTETRGLARGHRQKAPLAAELGDGWDSARVYAHLAGTVIVLDRRHVG